MPRGRPSLSRLLPPQHGQPLREGEWPLPGLAPIFQSRLQGWGLLLGSSPSVGRGSSELGTKGEGDLGFFAESESEQGKTIVQKQVQNKNKNRTRGEKRRIADADAVAKKTPKKKKARTSRRFIARLPLSRTIDRCPLPLPVPVPVPGLFGFPDVFPLLFSPVLSLQATAESTERDYLRYLARRPWEESLPGSTDPFPQPASHSNHAYG